MRSLAQKLKAFQRSESPGSIKQNRMHSGHHPEAGAILHLQRAVGNQAVQRMLQTGGHPHEERPHIHTPPPFSYDLSRIPAHATPGRTPRPKLKVSVPGDPYEREADRVADQVVGGPETAAVSDDHPSLFRSSFRSSAGVEGDDMHTPAGGRPLPAFSQAAISSLTGGAPLPTSELAFFEPRFNRSFKNVRIHSGRDADAAARSINARAFTLGNDIGFARGQYRPGTRDGRRLLAHELTHTLQQGRQQVSADTVQADFWDTLGRGWEMYWGVDDEGAPFARQLMEHYLLGFGTDFDVSSGSDPAWNGFMLGRPEIQRDMRPVLEAVASRVAGAGPTDQPWFRWGAGPTVNETVTGVRLNELESMRLTLHGCHRIEVEVNYDVNAISGGHEVIFRRVSMTWVDVADMHPGTTTELDSGEEVDDAELTSAGSSYNIYIEFDPSQSPVNERTVYHVSGGSVTQISGWPPIPGAAAPGRRD